MVIVRAFVEFFKHKLAGSIIILACWPSFESVKLSRELSRHGVASTITCDPTPLSKASQYALQGVVYVDEGDDGLLTKVKTKQFAHWFKWLIIGREVPHIFNSVRYDVDVSLLDVNASSLRKEIVSFNSNAATGLRPGKNFLEIHDVYVHPRDGASLHRWATWTADAGLRMNSSLERQRILRRQDMKGFPLSIVIPIGLYTADSYPEQTFQDYLRDHSTPQQDSSIRAGYGISSLAVENLNATEVVQDCLLWGTDADNTSMLNIIEHGGGDVSGAILRLLPSRASRVDAVTPIWPFSEVVQDCLLWGTDADNTSMLNIIEHGGGDVSGAILRLLPSRASRVDAVTPIWPFSVGFIYVAERDSSSNMFVEPFSAGVWWCVLLFVVLLALAQKVTARKPIESEGAFMAVLATWLQQDASGAPEGISGRWTFTVMSISSMLVHAYYTSAIVSALMSTGTNGPDTLAALADSKYGIASEDYDWLRSFFFEVETDWGDLEYLKRKKKDSKFYQDVETGMELVRQGGTAYHAEYNHVYPHLKKFTDDQICKLDRVDTVPEILTWILATHQGQWTSSLRASAAWMHETGLARRLLARIRIQPPPCRAALLAERVKLGDIGPLLALTAAGGALAVLLLAVEIAVGKCRGAGNMGVVDDAVEEDE